MIILKQNHIKSRLCSTNTVASHLTLEQKAKCFSDLQGSLWSVLTSILLYCLPCCPTKTLGPFLSQSLCACCFLCTEYLSSRFRRASFPYLLRFLLKCHLIGMFCPGLISNRTLLPQHALSLSPALFLSIALISTRHITSSLFVSVS